MVEAERVLARERGALRLHEALAGEGEERRAERRSLVGRQELGDRAAPEVPTDDRSALQDCTLVEREPVEPFGEHGLDRRRDLLASLGGDCEQLLDEQRVAPGTLDNAIPRLAVEATVAELLEERNRVLVRERFELERPADRAPRRADVEQFRTGEA